MTLFGKSLGPVAVRALALGFGLVMLGACSTTNEAANTGAAVADNSAQLRGSARPGSQDDLKTNVGDTIYFDLDSHSLRSDAQATLQKQAQWLKANPSVRMVIEGHADERGTREYNLALGDRRAGSVREFLVSNGVDGARLEPKSYGKERPICAESDEGCWGQNRRGYSLIVGSGTGAGL
ncbi:MAG TPA: peptidoglycan-associated lipoprotein Pal [Alphaproteobacteria bacterium]|nr:peptidoglycan-associated lipoprotein Pal [Alphaproteobacteria bacterium]HAJ47714.1 peptidoglycan-associated lipoprotein Pal [Alphaproteobacteria bacterium]